MPFDEIQFPVSWMYGSVGGPKFFTTVGQTRSGQEYRNANWSQARHVYQPVKEIQDQDAVAAILTFFNARMGMYRGFRFKDWSDYAFTDTHTLMPGYSIVKSLIPLIDGETDQFQMYKHYISGGVAYSRPIYKPVAGSVRVWVNDTEQVSPTWTFPWAVNTATGIITFSGTPPVPPGDEVEAYCEFDVPVRFNTDWLPTQIDEWNINSIRDLELIEIRDIV